MCKCFIPFAHAHSIYEIDVKFFVDNKVKYLLIDLDNTLDSYLLYTPSERAFKFIEMLKENKIKPIVVSNNKGKRVSSYANALDVPYIHSAMKPFPVQIKKFIYKNYVLASDIMFVGDQLLTDVVACHGAKVNCILTEKIVREDQLTTRFNRIFDKPIRKHLTKKGLIKDWREVWQKQ